MLNCTPEFCCCRGCVNENSVLCDVNLRCWVRRYRKFGSCSSNDTAPRHKTPVLSCTLQSEQNGGMSAGALILNLTFRSTTWSVSMCTAQWSVSLCTAQWNVSMCTAQWSVRLCVFYGVICRLVVRSDTLKRCNLYAVIFMIHQNKQFICIWLWLSASDLV